MGKSKNRFSGLEEVKKATRTFSIDRAAIDKETRTVSVAFSSQSPVRQWFGMEVLEHRAGAVRMGRLQSGAPVLVEHDTTDHVGIVEVARVEDEQYGRAELRFGRSERAKEIFRDIQDGIRPKVSVGYLIFKMEEETAEDGTDLYRVLDWEPYEVSIVSVPADNLVGVGRSEDAGDHRQKGAGTMRDEGKPADATRAGVNDVDAGDRETDRIRKIHTAAGEWTARVPKVAEWAREAVARGATVEVFQERILEAVASESDKKSTSFDIGLTDREAQSFRIGRAIRALAEPGNRRLQEEAAFEFEASDATAKLCGRSPQGIFLSGEIQRLPIRRDLNTGTATEGAELVATEVRAQDFIDVLRDEAVVMQVATVLRDLRDTVAIPKKTSGSAATSKGEGVDLDQSDPAFTQVPLTPHTIGDFSEFTHRLLRQSSIDVENMLKEDLASGIGQKIESLAFSGAGGGGTDPEGLDAKLTAIGIAGAALAWGDVVALETAVGQAKALKSSGRNAYITDFSVGGNAKSTEKATGSGFMVMSEQMLAGRPIMNGYPTLLTTNVPVSVADHSMYFGAWENFVIGMWGPVDILVDPYTNSASGTVRVRAMIEMDFAVRWDEAFAYHADIPIA